MGMVAVTTYESISAAAVMKTANVSGTNQYVLTDVPGRVAALARKYASDAMGAVDVEAAVPVARVSEKVLPTHVTLQEWEGVVQRVEDDRFFALMTNLTGPSEPLSDQGEIPWEELAEEDRARILPGSVFRWAIGYRKSAGVLERFSRIVVRHLPAWTARDLESANEFAAKYESIFADCSESATSTKTR